MVLDGLIVLINTLFDLYYNGLYTIWNISQI